MRYFLKVTLAEMKKQHSNNIHNKKMYISHFLWPILTFISAYYSYKPFNFDKISSKVSYLNEHNILIFMLIGYMSLQFFQCLIQSAWNLSYERVSGTLELIYLTPASRLGFVAGNAISSLFESIWLFVVFSAAVLFINGSSMKVNIITLIVGIVLAIIMAMLWGMLLNAIFLFSRDSGFLFTVLQEPMEMFAGIKTPTAIFPFWAKVLSVVFPLTYCAEILRRAVLNGSSLWQIKTFLLGSIIVGLIMFVTTILCLRAAEKYAKRTGNMALF
ncbi:ABC transporter permease [Clostridium sp. 19966]|uniref:ABC transporter permease n=1 Tax=Clostridium sp. 19966 TaxID=2768166 RepID=UPI0028DFAA8B|nr:ABC transporter permease [Clostridium sp. 19966]MDT8717927.1 ABC transporter permease [Clostridium sp. 19966]